MKGAAISSRKSAVLFKGINFNRIMALNLAVVVLAVLTAGCGGILLKAKVGNALAYSFVIILLGVFIFIWFVTCLLLKRRVHQGLDLQKEIIAIADHDIRNPLSAARSGAALLHQRYYALSDETKLDIIRAMEMETAQMLNIVEDLMDITRIESGMRDFFPEEFEALEALRHQIKQFEILDQGKHNIMLRLGSEVKDSGANFPLRSDRFKFERIVNNLLANALRYAADRSVVGIVVMEGGEGITVGVRSLLKDALLDPSDLPHLFEKYYLAEKAGRRVRSSSGLGLYIARNLTEILKGKIWAELKGKELVFWFTLPNLN